MCASSPTPTAAPPATGSESQLPPAQADQVEVVEAQHESLVEEAANQALALASANKASLREILVAIPETRALIASTAIRCLSAKRIMSRGKGQGVEVVDDGVTQMKAAAFLASYMDGVPVQTTMNLNVDASRDLPIEESLQRSPALVEALERAVARAKAVQQRGPRKWAGPQRESSADSGVQETTDS